MAKNKANFSVTIDANGKPAIAGLSKFETALKKTESMIKNISKRLDKFGATLTKTITAPIIAMTGIALKSAAQQEQAELKLASALRATGQDVESNMKRFKEFASEMQKLTTTGDEVSLAMLQFATSAGLGADEAQRAVKNAIAMEGAFGMNAQSAMRLTVALEQGNAEMLKRYLPSLRNITSESEMLAEAQKILTGAFSVSVDNASTFSGSLIQMKNAIGDLGEVIVQDMLKPLTNFFKTIKTGAENFQNLDSTMRKNIVGIGAVLALLGPGIVLVSKLIKLLPVLIAGFTGTATAVSALTFGIPILIGLVGSLAVVINNNIQAQKNFDSIIKKIDDDILKAKGITDQKKRVEELTKAYSKLNEEEKKSVLEMLQRQEKLAKSKAEDARTALKRTYGIASPQQLENRFGDEYKTALSRVVELESKHKGIIEEINAISKATTQTKKSTVIIDEEQETALKSQAKQIDIIKTKLELNKITQQEALELMRAQRDMMKGDIEILSNKSELTTEELGKLKSYISINNDILALQENINKSKEKSITLEEKFGLEIENNARMQEQFNDDMQQTASGIDLASKYLPDLAKGFGATNEQASWLKEYMGNTAGLIKAIATGNWFEAISSGIGIMVGQLQALFAVLDFLSGSESGTSLANFYKSLKVIGFDAEAAFGGTGKASSNYAGQYETLTAKLESGMISQDTYKQKLTEYQSQLIEETKGYSALNKLTSEQISKLNELNNITKILNDEKIENINADWYEVMTAQYEAGQISKEKYINALKDEQSRLSEITSNYTDIFNLTSEQVREINRLNSITATLNALTNQKLISEYDFNRFQYEIGNISPWDFVDILGEQARALEKQLDELSDIEGVTQEKFNLMKNIQSIRDEINNIIEQNSTKARTLTDELSTAKLELSLLEVSDSTEEEIKNKIGNIIEIYQQMINQEMNGDELLRLQIELQQLKNKYLDEELMIKDEILSTEKSMYDLIKKQIDLKGLDVENVLDQRKIIQQLKLEGFSGIDLAGKLQELGVSRIMNGNVITNINMLGGSVGTNVGSIINDEIFGG